MKPSTFEWMEVRSRAWQMQLLRALRFQSATASAGTALLNIIEGEQDSRRQLAFLPCRTVLKGGDSFSEALRALKLMDAATMAIITAGERAGDLKSVIQHAIEHTEEKCKGTKIIMAAISWMAFDTLNVVSVVWAAQFQGIPYLKTSMKSTDPDKVAHFNHAITVASWINGSLLALIIFLMAGAALLFVVYWLNRHRADHFTARMMMKAPVLSSYVRNVSLQNTFKLMQRLLLGKVPLADTLSIIVENTFEPATRLYLNESRDRIMAGVEPSRALARWPLNKGERDQIATIQSVDQLSEVYASIAEERGSMAKADKRRLAIMGVFGTMVVIGAVVLNAIYLLSIQNEGMLGNLTSSVNGN
jgi:type II secretory pathway component PulF